jgi:tRNA(fMet)-specific endonuclease VapC
MNGKSLLLDTNAVVALLQGNQQLLQLTREAGWIGISIISQIEFLCFPGLTDPDRNLFVEFLAKVEVVGLHADDHDLVDKAVEIRRTFPVKIPDAIIAATALIKNASLVTADRQLETIKNLPIISF